MIFYRILGCLHRSRWIGSDYSVVFLDDEYHLRNICSWQYAPDAISMNGAAQVLNLENVLLASDERKLLS